MQIFTTALLALGLLAGCDKTPECIDNGQCGDMQACVQDKCEDVDCLSSTDCTLHQFCDTQGYVCRDGCDDTEDCKSGEVCLDDRKCHPQDCRTSTLDCAVGQVCTDGDCRDYAGHLCDRCDPLEDYLGMEPCGAHGSCWLLEEGDSMGYCFPDCNPAAEDACPAGFTCEEFPDATNGCFAFCPTLLENGWL